MKLLISPLKFLILSLIFSVGCVGNSSDKEEIPGDEDLQSLAKELADKFIIVDTHVDIPYRLRAAMEDISIRTKKGDFDYVRAREGGLDAPFMSIYVSSDHEKQGGGKILADSLIDMVEGIVRDNPDKFALAYSAIDVEQNFNNGLISLPMGMENGTPVEGNLDNLLHFKQRGIRYITLTHALDNHICDSSYDTTSTWNGLSPFGKEVVTEMNKLGIMIDVSHISDNSFYQVMELSKAPVIASHSSCRAFTPGWERNMADDMIKLLGENGGVIQINFGSSFLDSVYVKKRNERDNHINSWLEENNLHREDSSAQSYIEKYNKDNQYFADVSHVVDHIDHVVKLAGIDHVGFGSDFDGVGDSLPNGLKDVSFYPNLIYHLLKRGYSEEEIEKICYKNTFRVWIEVDKVAEKLSNTEGA